MSTISLPMRFREPWMDTSESDHAHNPSSVATTPWSSSHHRASPRADISRHRTKIDMLKGSPARRSHATGMHALFTCAKTLDKESELLAARSQMSISGANEFKQSHLPSSLVPSCPPSNQAGVKDLSGLDIAAQAVGNDTSSEDWTGDDEFFPMRRHNGIEADSKYQSSGSAFFEATHDADATDTSDSCKLQKAARHRRKVVVNQPHTPISRSNTAYDGDIEDDEGPITPLSPAVEIHRGSARHRFARKKRKSQT